MTEDVARGAAAERGGDQPFSAEDSPNAVNGTEIQLAAADVVVARPVPGEIVHISTEAGATYVLDFDPGEARVLVDGDSLILVFEDGGQIVFDKLVALAQADDAPSVQYAGADLIPVLVAQGVIPGVFGEVQVAAPEPGQVIIITAEGGVRYVIAFDPTAAQVVVEGENLVLLFANGGRIVFQGLGELAGGPDAPTFEIGGTEIPGETLMAQAVALAGGEAAPETPATLEAAAGEEVPQGTGETRYQDDLGQPIDLLDPQGVIPPVEFTFGVPELEPGPVVLGEEPGAPPSLTVTFRTPAVGVDGGGFEDWQPFQNVGDTTVAPMQILVAFAPAEPGQTLTGVTVSGIPAGAKFFVGGTGAGDEVAVAGGSVGLSPAQLASGIWLLPPADSDADIPLTFTAAYQDPDGGTATVATSATAIIDAVADKPEGDLFGGESGEGDFFHVAGMGGGEQGSFWVDGGDGDVIDVADEFCLTEEGTVFVRLEALFGDFLDGSETHTYVIEGVPAEWTEASDSAGVTGVDFVKQADGTWLATVSGDGDAGWITFQTNEWTGETTLTVRAVADENPASDGELTLANNVAQIVGQVTLCIDEDTPILQEPTNLRVDEDDLVPLGSHQSDPLTDNGTVSVQFFSDQPADLTGAFAFTGGTDLGAGPNGEDIVYTAAPDGQSLTASIGGADVFTVAVTGATDNGGGDVTYHYEVTLLAEMDHLFGDNIQSTFDFTANFTITDSDGDPVGGSFTVTVVDDVPTADVQGFSFVNVDEDGLVADGDTNVWAGDNAVAIGSLGAFNINFGADGPGAGGGVSFDPTLDGTSAGVMSGGVAVLYDVSADGLTLTAYLQGGAPDNPGDVVFTVELLEPSDSQYTATLFRPIDHTGDDTLQNFFFDLIVIDGDGDSVTIAEGMAFTIFDANPTAADDFDFVAAGAWTDGNVITGADANDADGDPDSTEADAQGADDSLDVVGVAAGDTGTNLVDGGTVGVVINGSNGTLKLNADGSYTYTANADPVSGTDVFTYTIRDFDGDLSNATLTISLDDLPAPADASVTHDETAEPQFFGSEDNTEGATDDDDSDEAADPALVAAVESALGLGGGSLSAIGQDSTALTLNPGINGLADVRLDLASLNVNGNTATDGTALSVIYSDDTLIVLGTDATTPVLSLHVVDSGDADSIPDTFVVVQYEALRHDDSPANYDEPLTSPITVDYVVEDGDGSLGSATVTVQIEDDGPALVAGTSTDTVFENELATAWSTGNDQAGITGDDDNATPGNDDTVAMGSVASLVDFGADGPASGGGFSLSGDTSGLEAQGWTSKGAPVQYSVSGNTLTAFVDVSGGTADVYDPGTDRAVFTLVLAANGDWTFTLMDQLDHVIADGNDTSLTIDLSSAVVATDGDGDTIALAGGFTVAVVDDVPADINPDRALVANIGDPLSSVSTEALDFAGSIGADELGQIFFSGGTDGDQAMGDLGLGLQPLTSNGAAILLEGFGTGTLVGFVDVGGTAGAFDDGIDTKVFEITLDPVGDTYTITLFDTIDNGGGIVFDDFSDAPAGNNDFIGIDDPRTGSEDQDQDLLFTGGNPNLGGDEVNTSSTGVGVNAQSIDVNLTLRLDYVTGVNLSGGTDESSGLVSGANGDSKDITQLFYDGHYGVNNASFTIVQTGGNASNRVDAYVQVYDATDLPGSLDPSTPYDPTDLTNDPLDDITRVLVFDGSGTLLEDTGDLANFDDPTIQVTFDPFGPDGALVEGLLEDYQVFVMTADGFNRMEVTNLTTGPDLGYTSADDPNQYIDFSNPDNPTVVNPAANDTFDLGGFELQTLTAGNEVDMSFGVTTEDEDGDQASGQVDVTVLPNEIIISEQINGGSGNDNLLGDDNGELLRGEFGNDTLDGGAGDDVLDGGRGDDTLTGGPGVDTFVFDLGTDDGTDIVTDFNKATETLSLLDVVDGAGDDVADVDAMISSIFDAGGHVAVAFDNGTTVEFANIAFASQTSIADLVDDPNQIQVTHA